MAAQERVGDDAPAIAVVVVTWNALDLVARCLDRLAPQLAPGDEVVVVDNGSTDDTRAWIATAHPHVRLVALAENQGFAGGCDVGLAAADRPWVFTLNNDAFLEAGCLDRLRRAAREAAPDVGALQPLVRFDDEAARVQSTGIVVFASGHAEDRHFGADPAVAVQAGDPFGPTAGAALWRRAMLDRLRLPSGVLDRRFFMYFEDVDLAWRARLAGWRTTFVPDAVVRHRWQGTSRRHGTTFVHRMCTLNRVRCLAKNASLRFALRSSRRTAGDFLWLGRRLGGRALGLWLHALGQGLAARRAVTRLARVRRRALERAWVAPR